MLLVDDDQSRVRQWREHGRAGAEHHPGAAVARVISKKFDDRISKLSGLMSENSRQLQDPFTNYYPGGTTPAGGQFSIVEPVYPFRQLVAALFPAVPDVSRFLTKKARP